MMLCLRKRWNVTLKFGKTLEETIVNNLPALKYTFEKVWSKHKCEKPGCSSPRTLVADGNLKSVRRICAARSAGAATFETTPNKVLTGCTRLPTIGRKFCSYHENKTPNIPYIQIYENNPEILPILRDRKFRHGRRQDEHGEDIYTIEGIWDIIKTDGKTLYLISWENCPGVKTWVSSAIIPSFLIKSYDQNGPQTTPKPRMKEEITSEIHGTRQFLLTWDDDDSLKEF